MITSTIIKAINSFNIKGFVISNISNLLLLDDLFNDKNTDDKLCIPRKSFDLIANYTFNVFNSFTVKALKNFKINTYTISPELDTNSILELTSSKTLNSELIVYGKIPLMNMSYCLLGKSNKCYPNCSTKCKNTFTSNKKYFLKDRYGFTFDIIPDNLQTVTTIYSSKTTSISIKDFKNVNNARIDILYEDIDSINKIIENVFTL